MITNPFEYAILAGKLLTGTHDVYEDVFIVIKNGKIQKVTDSWNGPYVDFSNATITPGFIEPYSKLGIKWSIHGELFSDSRSIILDPDYYVIDGLNYSDPSIRDAREFGVTTAYISPGGKSVRLGRGAVIKTMGASLLHQSLYKKTILEILLESPDEYYESDLRMNILREFRKLYANDKKFRSILGNADRVFVVAMSYESIETALNLAQEFKFLNKLTIVGAPEAIKVASYIKEFNIPIVYGPFWITDPLYLDRWNFNNVVRLYRMGITVSLSTFHPLMDIKLLQLAPALAIRYDLNEKEATSIFSHNAAVALGIQNIVGIISPGKDADLVVWEAEAYDMKEGIKEVYIRGVRVSRTVSIPQ